MRCVITQKVFPATLRALEAAGVQAIANTSGCTLSGSEVLKRVRDNDADALFAFMTDSVDGDFLDSAPSLRVVGVAAKGLDNFDHAACCERDVTLTRCEDHLTAPTAELAIALLLAASRRLQEGHEAVTAAPAGTEGAFCGWEPRLYGNGVYGSTIGVVGFGAVGQAIARRLLPFEPALVNWYDPAMERLLFGAGEGLGGSVTNTLVHGAQQLVNVRGSIVRPHSGGLDGLLTDADAVVLAAPLTHETCGLIDRERLALMCGSGEDDSSATDVGTILVNVGRGSVVDESAVAEALRAGPHDGLGAYASDVFSFEDWALQVEQQGDVGESDSSGGISEALRTAPRTVFTPHLGSATVAARRAIELDTAAQIVAALETTRC